jgi:hypothetical protein
MTADPAEAARRRQLVDALSDANITALSDQMRKARTALARRVYGGSELAVLDLMRDLEQLIELLQDFDDTRTEN